MHKLHLVARTMTALQAMGFQSNYRWNRCEMEHREAEDDDCENSGERAGATEVGKNLICC